ncbi:hypothetical protein F4780DRAFT_739270 [Xylariomycetidae sp. FL0641]|nr:hypothetical protein F4780DRAFT_739270 [Xylariomycetidae sp. FL0641]
MNAFVQPHRSSSSSTSSSSTTIATVSALSRATRAARHGPCPQAESLAQEQHARRFLGGFWETLVAVARRLDHRRRAQDDLVELVKAIRRLPVFDAWDPPERGPFPAPPFLLPPIYGPVPRVTGRSIAYQLRLHGIFAIFGLDNTDGDGNTPVREAERVVTHTAGVHRPEPVEGAASIEPVPVIGRPIERKLWSDLAQLETYLRDIWIPPTEYEDSYAALEAWVNLNSFVARLAGAGLVDLPELPFITLHDALEGDELSKADLLECRVVAAAQWILHGSERLYKDMVEGYLPTPPATPPPPPPPGSPGNPSSQSRTLGAGGAPHLWRWRRWKGRFEEHAQRRDLPGHTAAIALLAVQKMTLAERRQHLRASR